MLGTASPKVSPDNMAKSPIVKMRQWSERCLSNQNKYVFFLLNNTANPEKVIPAKKDKGIVVLAKCSSIPFSKTCFRRPEVNNENVPKTNDT